METPGAGVREWFAMSHKHARVLTEVFRDPVRGNIHWRDVESLLHHLGAEMSYTHGARLHVVLNGREGVVHRPHHSGECGKQDIRHLRRYLASAGVTPARYEAEH
jgi:hypothetical protein